MAGRDFKQGLDYFPLDVDFMHDMKIRKIMKACGMNSISVLIYLLGIIYKDKGYYIQWDSDVAFLVADVVGAKEGFVTEVVEKAASVGFFDEKMLKDFQILTSKGIQDRYFDIVKKLKRKSIEYDATLMLISINDVKNAINVGINSINDGINEQKKRKVNVKEKEKEKEKKGKESIEAILSTVENADLKTAVSQFIESRKELKKPLTVQALRNFLARIGREFESDEERIEAINISIERGWLSVQKEWIENIKSKPSRRNGRSELEDYYDRVDRWAEEMERGGDLFGR